MLSTVEIVVALLIIFGLVFFIHIIKKSIHDSSIQQKILFSTDNFIELTDVKEKGIVGRFFVLCRWIFVEPIRWVIFGKIKI
jgi:hypothetical protein